MPTLRHSSSANSSACSSTTLANRCIVRPRVTGDSAPHVSYAPAAAATARLTSSTPASATVASGRALAGFSTSNVRPSAAGRRSPPITSSSVSVADIVNLLVRHARRTAAR